MRPAAWLVNTLGLLCALILRWLWKRPTVGAAVLAWMWLAWKIGEAKRSAGYVAAGWLVGWGLAVAIIHRKLFGEWPSWRGVIESADSIVVSLARRRRVLAHRVSLFDHAGIVDTRSKRVVPLRRDRAWITPAGNVRLIVPAGAYGLDVDDIRARARKVKSGLGCVDAFVREWDPARSPWWWTVEKAFRPGDDVEVELVYVDELSREVRISDLPEPPAGRIPIMVQANTDPILLYVDRSWIVIGETRSGKSTLVWAAIDSLRRHVRHVELAVADPKGGMEFDALGKHLPMGRYARSAEGIAELVIRQWEDCQDRQEELRLAGVNPLRVYTEKMPLRPLIIDEALFVLGKGALGLTGDKAKKFNLAILGLLTQGAAAGFPVWAGAQSATEADLGEVKKFFPQRTAMRAGVHMVRGVFGDRTDAAPAWNIGFADAGMGYHLEEGMTPVRGKAPNVRPHEREIIARCALVPLDRPALRVLDTPCHVYRLYGPVRMFPGGPVVREYGLLYVGISSDPERRLAQHREDRWWRADIVAQVVDPEVYPSKELAETVEAKAIRKERPPHNRKHNPPGAHQSVDVARVVA